MDAAPRLTNKEEATLLRLMAALYPLTKQERIELQRLLAKHRAWRKSEMESQP